jgi:hypothetical protein
MTRWQDFVDDAPLLAARVQDRFSVRKHCTLATLRADGSPRISGSEVEFADGDLRIGSMPGAMKAKDLVRDPRLGLHSPTVDPPSDEPSKWEGEGKVAGRAVAVASPDEAHRFVIDISEVVLTHLDDEGKQLVITSWHPGRGTREIRRA